VPGFFFSNCLRVLKHPEYGYICIYVYIVQPDIRLLQPAAAAAAKQGQTIK